MKIDTKDPQLHAQRQKVMLALAQQYTNGQGQVKLTEAFKTRPDYQSELAALGLDTPSRLNAYVLHMRRTGVLPQTKGFASQKKPRQTPRRKRFPERDYALAHHMYRLYHKDGRQQFWKQAFAEHPDWAKRFGYPKKAAMSFIYRALKTPDPGGPIDDDSSSTSPAAPQTNGAPKPERAPMEQAVCAFCGFNPPGSGGQRWKLLAQHYAEAHRPTTAEPAEPVPFNYCPKCGINVLMFTTALKIAAKHSRRGE